MRYLFAIFILFNISLQAVTIKVASYNVENLFDLHRDGNEYEEYIPFNRHGWNEKVYRIKLHNIAQVICDLKPDIIGLEEVESDRALKDLQRSVKACGWKMQYRAIADRKPTVVKTALLSRYPIVAKREIDPNGRLDTRNILETTLDIQGHPLKIFVNHWKSRSGPESRRIVSAKALMRRLMQLPKSADYIVLGDFNSDWNEYKTLPKSPRLNDTRGITGINHILKTLCDGKPVTKRTIHWPCHYDLWYELPPQKRWSHNFYGQKTALDHILLPASMFDGKNIDYVNKSFRRFTPYYLFTRKGAVNRWQIDRRRRGRDLGKGYSDHLPIYALFSDRPFKMVTGSSNGPIDEASKPPLTDGKTVRIADLYRMPVGWSDVTLHNAAVIYKKGDIAILKSPQDRGILVYRDTRKLRFGHAYDLKVRKLYDYKGLREITKLEILKDRGRIDPKKLYISPKRPIDDPKLVNEVLRSIEGTYRRHYLHTPYGSIRLYFKNRRDLPRNGEKIHLQKVRIGIYRFEPEIVVDSLVFK